MIRVIEQNTITVAVNNQTRLKKPEISGVDRKGVTNRSSTGVYLRGSMLNEHLEWETSNEESGTGAFPFQAVDLKIYRKKSDYNLAWRVVDLLRQNPPLRESRG
jgi:hypothetical protein